MVPLLSACGSGQAPQAESSKPVEPQPIRIQLNGRSPSESLGVLERPEGPLRFGVGHGRHGIACAGTRFQEGVTPLGRFRVNAILSGDRFAMDPELVQRSGRTEDELRATLFSDMNSIDFSGDGQSGEYGIGYISLEPVPATDQPFAFNTYDGRFRWYSFAIHGTNDEARVGQAVTGGCLNVSQPSLKALLDRVALGDTVVISSDGPCLR